MLPVWLEVLRHYQTLFPMVFLVANFNLTKLLITVSGQEVSPEVTVSMLQLLIEAPDRSTKWTQKVCRVECRGEAFLLSFAAVYLRC